MGAKIRLWFKAARPFSFPASLAGVFVGTAAAAPMKQWVWWVFLAELLFVLLVHAFGNLINDYFDWRSGVDRNRADDAGRPGRALVRGLLLPRQVVLLALACLTLALPLGVLLLTRGGWQAALIGFLGAAGAYTYTGRPFEFKYHALGELCLFLVFGPAIVAGAVWMQVGRLDPRALSLSLPLGLAITAILAAGNLRDCDEDRDAGVYTLSQLLGRRGYRVFFLGLLLGAPIALIILVAMRVAPAWSLLALLSLPLALQPAANALRASRVPDADAVTARYMTAFGALLFIGLTIGGGAR